MHSCSIIWCSGSRLVSWFLRWKNCCSFVPSPVVLGVDQPPNVLLLVVISSLSLTVLYAYKFLRDVYFTNALHLTIFAILISQMAACSCKLVPYAYKFSEFYFCESPLIRKIRKNKVPQNLYAYGMSAREVPVQVSTPSTATTQLGWSTSIQRPPVWKCHCRILWVVLVDRVTHVHCV